VRRRRVLDIEGCALLARRTEIITYPVEDSTDISRDPMQKRQNRPIYFL
jgi:hypothetical protein